ncbi:MAG TPA: Gfo/Idh/MocA family oxidoreductase [Acidimicrobiales bacterium]|nr:Gfo/Idh/MocA family oxidoreductase [Acidimicrobiales bacterium]
MRVGVIGRGFGGRVVAPAFAATEGCEVVDVVSPRDSAAVAALCDRSDVDLVSVHSPPFLHLDHVRRAVEAGHDVLCDKPFGRNAAESAAMLALATDAGVLHFLNFENRYDPARQCVRAALAEGVVGQPEHVAVTMLMAISRSPLRPYGWLFDAASGGGWLRAMGSHLVDFARWTFGEIVEVGGQLRTAVPSRPDADGQPHACTADDGFALTLRSDRGVSVVMDSSSAAPLHLPLSLLVVGSHGVVEEAAGRVVVRTPDGDRELLAAAPGTNPLVAAMQRYAEVLRDAVHDRAAPPDAPTFDDGLACAVVMDAAG